MSERMTKDDADRAMSIGKANAWGRDMRLAALDDWKRARASEEEKTLESARLLNEREEMEKTNKALADALEGTGYVDRGEWHTEVCHEIGEHRDRCANAVAALRLAGRL